MNKPAFILASASPRRLDLLRDMGIVPAKVISTDIDETPRALELPSQLVTRLSLAKLNAAMTCEPHSFILAADTIVACGRRILPKAETVADVRMCLKLLAGRRHRVITGVALQTPQNKITQRTVTSIVAFNQMSMDDIDAYAASGEGIGKAGGYAIQGRAAAHIRFISGSYSNIVGLPLFDVAQILRGAGFVW